MTISPSTRREHARSIWDAAVAAANPTQLVRETLHTPPAELGDVLGRAGRILVVGGGKAGSAMALGVEEALAGRLDRVEGILNVPAETVRPLQRIRLHAGRPAGVNHPTAEGVAGVEQQLALAATATSGDVGLCLLSGGGSALLPAPAEGISLEDKQAVTRLLHSCGATINEMNCVRKHLSRYKGGRLAQVFADRGCPLFTLIISDVIGDPLDVIASGPTAADPSTFGDALEILRHFDLTSRVPPRVLAFLEEGSRGHHPETLEDLPGLVHNWVLGNNARSLAASRARAEALGYRVLDLGSFIEGETAQAGIFLAGIVRSILAEGRPLSPPACILSGGETTVTLGDAPGTGGRNQELVLACLCKLGEAGLPGVTVLSGGTDGEDGPTDAAGACADADTLLRARQQGLDPRTFLARHDAYTFFKATDALLQPGLTQTNVMDVRVLLVTA